MQKTTFDVIVVATMSAGKSTVINALIGKELLHSANESTTATITRIHDKDDLPSFSGNAYSYQNKLIEENHQIDAETLRRWNADSKIKTIDLVGDIQALQNDQLELVIYDTPGPNNSQDDNHEALTMEVVNSGNYGMILYVLNATQLGVNDDRSLLEKIHKELEKDKNKEIIFLLNKADELDEEKNEGLDSAVLHAKTYLEKIGFSHPVILPTAANYALVINKVINNEKLTRSQRADLKEILDYSNNTFIEHSSLSNFDKEVLKNQTLLDMTPLHQLIWVHITEEYLTTKQRLERTLVRTGFGAIKYLLQKRLAGISQNFSNTQEETRNKKQETRNKKSVVSVKTKPNLIKQSSQINKQQPQIKDANMSNVFISHNPFTVETVFEIDGNPIQSNFTETNRTRRLQLWIEQLFAELYNFTNGNTHFHVTFQGVEADWLDVEEAAKNAAEQGMSIQTEWIQSADPVARIDKIQSLMKEAEQHPDFGENLKQSPKIRQMFNEAMNKDFDVYVAVTMSSGKSTLINAMLGTDLLPAANEATTATIAQITDNDAMPTGEFIGRRFDKSGNEVNGLQKVSLETLKEWNSLPDTKLIQLEGNVIGINERENVRLVITDTPGPNNSQDMEHARTTMQHIQDSVRNPLILYILNATQLGTNDDQQVLGEIAKIMQKGGKQSKDRFIFVVNKMDAFDLEAGENVEAALGRVTEYLKNNGIENPLIYPVSANLTRLLRKRAETPDLLTRKERGDLVAMEDLFNEEPTMDLVQYMPLTSSARRNLKEKKLPAVLERSGLPAIESMIDEYIDKYNLPNRVNRAYQALSEAIRISSDENNLAIELERHSKDAEAIEMQLKNLVANKDHFAKAQAKMDAVIKDKKSLYPSKAISKIDEAEGEIRQKIFRFQDEFIGSGDELTPKQAERKIKMLTENINFEASRLINSLDNVILEAQEITQDKLGKVFNDYVKDLFEGLDGIPLPVLDSLKTQVGNIATITGLGLDSGEIEERVTTERVKTGTEERYVKVGTRTVSTSKWYNPFSWGGSCEEDVYDYRTFDKYEDVTKRTEYVDADALWENREFEISHYFNQLTQAAAQKVQDDTEAYALAFKNFMEKEFDVKFKVIIADLQAKTANKAQIEKLATEAKEKLARINVFKAELDEVLAL
ncbi:dynamin family protein [Actinobacillus lignieresii]|uniref:Predicted GTPase n=1 Tax=Actinobacillus lignieresii TaxID=720 RepID=A0A380TV65_ACTLI|nr:dynamin family protein [Actinobacillus lignieresii]SUT92573.1 Predicted GTPase [Actinobacillus lignieresii]